MRPVQKLLGTSRPRNTVSLGGSGLGHLVTTVVQVERQAGEGSENVAFRKGTPKA